VADPEESEIDADTWYEMEIPIYKADIMQFVTDLQHVIFRYKWNPQIWLEQFKRSAPQNHGGATFHHQKNATTD